MFEVFKTSERLPPLNIYVLVHYCGGNWISDDQDGAEWQVAQRREDINFCPNNRDNYEWCTFGALSMFGQNVDYWAFLPKLKKEKK